MEQQTLSKSEFFELYNGVKIPAIGLGTDYRDLNDDKKASHLIGYSIKAGFRLIDTAWMYHSEKIVGNVVKKCVTEGAIKREDLFIQTKVPHIRQGYNCTLEAFEKSLEKLQTDYVDSYLIHYPLRDKDNWRDLAIDTWRAMEKLYKEGKIRAIGVSNFLPHHLQYIMSKAEIKPMINQIEFHPWHQQEDTVEYCKENGILVQAWGSLCQGHIFEVAEVQNMAQKYCKKPSQIIFQWHNQQGFVPITKPCSEKEIKENINVFDFELNQTDMDVLNGLNGGGFSGIHTEANLWGKSSFVVGNNSFQPSVWSFKLFGFIPFLKIKNPKRDYFKYYLFNIPIMKKTKKIPKASKIIASEAKADYKNCKYKKELIFGESNGFFECPVYDTASGSVFCINYDKNTIYKIDPKTKKAKKYRCESHPGSIVLEDKDAILSAEKNGIYRIHLKKGKREFLIQSDKPNNLRHNDGKMDAKGRFLFGTIGEYDNGYLYSYDGKIIRPIVDNVTISNGIAFSLDNKIMYYIDSETKKIAKYGYNLETGSAIFDKYIIEVNEGTPDGMCVDIDDNLWVAEFDSHKVSKYDTKTYRKIDEIIFPLCVTSCCLGGKNLDYLYVTTAKSECSKQKSGLYRVKIR